MAKTRLRSTTAAAGAADSTAPAAPPSSLSNKRQLRSTTKRKDAAELEFVELDNGRSVKKRKTVPVYQCFGCDEELPSRKFPKYNPTGECEHLINFCTDCLRQWIETQVESAQLTPCGEDGKSIGVACPQCPKIMLKKDIWTAARGVHARFVELERKHFANTTPNWRWCLAPLCKEGQIHTAAPKPKPKKRDTSKTESDAEELESMIDICICDKCGAKACVPCDRPYHFGESCNAYQLRIKDRIEEEDKSIAAIRKHARQCPNPACNKKIEKNGGCKHMHCSQCNSNFCWNCMKVLRSNGYQVCPCSGRG